MSSKDLKKVGVLGTGLLGASLTLAAMRAFPKVRVVGYSHRASTRQKAREQGIAHAICDTVAECVAGADLVVLASPICTFEGLFAEMAGALEPGCIVTDVGSTKQLVHRWAGKLLPRSVHYVGSHPIAGSEKRGLDFARDDLFFGARCILTKTARTSADALARVHAFWTGLGSIVTVMTPTQHDRILGHVSHLPHAMAAALVNASRMDEMVYAGKGFIDTTRVASGPANVWSDIFLTNPKQTVQGIDRVIRQLQRLQKAIESGDRRRIEAQLESARQRRAELIDYKMRSNELL